MVAEPAAAGSCSGSRAGSSRQLQWKQSQQQQAAAVAADPAAAAAAAAAAAVAIAAGRRLRTPSSLAPGADTCLHTRCELSEQRTDRQTDGRK